MANQGINGLELDTLTHLEQSRTPNIQHVPVEMSQGAAIGQATKDRKQQRDGSPKEA